MPVYSPAVLLAVVASWGAGACGAWAVLDLLRRARQTRRMARGEIVVTETQSPFFRLFLPTARFLGQGVRASLASKSEEAPGFYRVLHRRIQDRLASAGNPEGIDADEYVGFVLISMILGGLLGVVAHLLAPMANVFAYFAIGATLGATRMPSWLSARRTLRHHSIRKELPFALDLFTLATEAGLDFTSALDRICRKLGRTPLGQEFSLMLREIRLGKTRSDAMRDLARRVDVQEVISVMTALVQAEEMGAHIGPILRIQAQQQRERRSQLAEETAGKMPVKMLFPLALIMMVVFLVIFGPMAIGFLSH